MSTRRTFLQQSAAAYAAAGFTSMLRPGETWLAEPNDLLAEHDEARLRELALVAVEAARAAGADFTDVRMSETRAFNVDCRVVSADPTPRMLTPALTRQAGYVVRAVVGGTWGMGIGNEITAEAVAAAARKAVKTARVNRARHRKTVELAPRPVVSNGRWESPIKEDPFAVSIKEYGDLGFSALATALSYKETTYARFAIDWRQPTTVYASSDGSVITQRMFYAAPTVTCDVRVGAVRGYAYHDTAVGPYGYEVLRAPTLLEEFRQKIEEAIRTAKPSSEAVSVEVGRYDLVLGPHAALALVGTTIYDALGAERALGFWTNSEGTSYAAPPDAVLGKMQIASKLITLRGDRNRPGGLATVGWDEEGVKPDAFTFVQDGVVMDYATSRQTAAEIGDVYRRRNQPVQSHGCVYGTSGLTPAVYAPNLTLEPGREDLTQDDLIRDTKRGFYLDAVSGRADQQVMSYQGQVWPLSVREITNGTLGGYKRDFGIQFITSSFWKGVDAVGGKSSVKRIVGSADPRAFMNPTQPFPNASVDMVPLRVRQVNVLNYGRTA